MKELIRGVVTLVGSLLVFTPVIIIGVLFNLIYPFYMAFKEKDWKLFFKIWWRLIDGTLSTIGNMLYDGVSVKWDEMGNVWGEWIEDVVTTTEKTQFGVKNTTVSASVGYLEHEKLPLFERGKKLSRLLNIVFRHKRHAIGSWEKKLAIKEIEDRNLHGKY